MAEMKKGGNIILFQLTDDESTTVDAVIKTWGPQPIIDLLVNYIRAQASNILAAQQKDLFTKYSRLPDDAKKQIDAIIAKSGTKKDTP